MRRSGQVAAPLLAAMALSVTTGCRRPEMQRCVDEQNRVVAESFCQANGVAPVAGAGQPGVGGMGYFPRYRYYYGGGGGWNPGTVVTGGGYSSLGGHSYTTSSAAPHAESFGGHVGSGSSGTTRGGFGGSEGGGSAGAHGGGGGS